MMAAQVAAQMKGGAAGAGAPGAGVPPAGGAGPGSGYGGGRPGGGAGYGGPGGAQRAGMDLSRMMSRLPAETLSGLKVGEAVMIVATLPGGESDKSTAVTLLTGVDQVLAASPTGQAATLSPWSIGGGEMGGEGGGMGPQ
jgi:hypothetical protein